MALGAHWSHKTPLVLSEHGIYLRERYLAYGHRDFSFRCAPPCSASTGV